MNNNKNISAHLILLPLHLTNALTEHLAVEYTTRIVAAFAGMYLQQSEHSSANLTSFFRRPRGAHLGMFQQALKREK
jgi:hypothetical protein